MAIWNSSEWTPATQINGGTMYRPADGLTADDVNKIVSNLLYMYEHGATGGGTNGLSIYAVDAYSAVDGDENNKVLILKTAINPPDGRSLQLGDLVLVTSVRKLYRVVDLSAAVSSSVFVAEYVGDCGENAPVVEVKGELTKAKNVVDFGTFDGLTEIMLVIKGVSDGETQNYFHVKINGTTTAFITRDIYKYGAQLHCKKVGNLWYVWGSSGGLYLEKLTTCVEEALNGAESITSLSIVAYGSFTFRAGTKYALEGRQMATLYDAANSNISTFNDEEV